MVKVLFYRENSGVFLEGSINLIERTRYILSPFITLSLTSSKLDSYWTIKVTNSIKIENHKDAYYYTPENEPTCEYFIDHSEKVIFLDANSYDGEWIVQNVVRLIRIIIRLDFYKYNVLYIHGGLIKVNGKGIAIVGAKKSGKTSTIISSLKQIDASFVTNDDLCIIQKKGEIRGLGWPRSISVRKDTFNKYFQDKDIESLSHPFNTVNTEIIPDNKFLYPKELINLTNSTIESCAKIDAIVFPRFLDDKNEASIIRLSEQESLAMLINNIVVNPGKFNDFLLSRSFIPNNNSLKKISSYVTSKIPCYRLNQNFSNLSEGSKILEKLTNKL